MTGFPAPLPIRFGALIFDFDGVLIESEYEGNRQLAEYLTGAGHPLTTEEAVYRFSGLAGTEFVSAIEDHIGRPLDDAFFAAREVENERVLDEGLDAVAGAVAFVRALPPALPRAIASSSRTRWIARHLEHLGLFDAFAPHLYSGREHVARGKPAPDLYRYAAARLGVPIGDCAILEDSVVGATGAVASGGYVIGLCAGRHCAIGHDDRLKAAGASAVARDFEQVAALLR